MEKLRTIGRPIRGKTREDGVRRNRLEDSELVRNLAVPAVAERCDGEGDQESVVVVAFVFQLDASDEAERTCEEPDRAAYVGLA